MMWPVKGSLAEQGVRLVLMLQYATWFPLFAYCSFKFECNRCSDIPMTDGERHSSRMILQICFRSLCAQTSTIGCVCCTDWSSSSVSDLFSSCCWMLTSPSVLFLSASFFHHLHKFPVMVALKMNWICWGFPFDCYTTVFVTCSSWQQIFPTTTVLYDTWETQC